MAGAENRNCLRVMMTTLPSDLYRHGVNRSRSGRPKKSSKLTSEHRATISLITDILVDNGVRGAGFLQQDQLRG
jgi:hypothetical protein